MGYATGTLEFNQRLDFLSMRYNERFKCQSQDPQTDRLPSIPTIVAPTRLSRRPYATEAEEKDLVIIGGGVAGYVAAIKAGQEGMKVTCIEKRGTLGGTCLNVGCIPSKALLNNSHLYHQILHDTKARGIEVGDVKLNLQQLMKSKDTAVSGLTKGVEFLFKKNNVEYVKGTASFAGEHEIKVNLTEGGEKTIVGKNIIIATGSEATPFPGLEIDEKRIITSTGAIALEKVPESMVVIGGGIIGLEMGSVWSRLGTKVTVVEFLGQIGGPGMDAEISKSAQKILKKQGIDFKLNTKVMGGEASGDKIKLQVEAAKGGKEETVSDPSHPYSRGICLSGNRLKQVNDYLGLGQKSLIKVERFSGLRRIHSPILRGSSCSNLVNDYPGLKFQLLKK